MAARKTTNASGRGTRETGTEEHGAVNAVELRGRVSGDPDPKVLPSGDEVVTMRLVVPRPTGGPVDTIDLACWSPATRRSAARLSDGDHVHVTGALRRRFFRTPAGAASRYEVEVTKVARLRLCR